MSEPEYIYRKGLGWIPGGYERRRHTVRNFDNTLDVTIIAREPRAGERGQWCEDNDYYCEKGEIDIVKLAHWAKNCVYVDRTGDYPAARLIPEGGVAALPTYSPKAVWFTIEIHEAQV